MSSGRRSALGLAAVAAACFSTAPVVLIWAEPLSAYEKSMWRMFIAAMTVAVMAWSQGKLPHYERGDGRKFALYGLVTALHFLTFIASLNFTSIAHSVTVTYTAPIFVTLFSALILKEHIPPRKWAGVLVFAANYPGESLWSFDRSFHLLLREPGRLLWIGTGWVLAKCWTCTVGTGIIAYQLGATPKESVRDVNRAVTTAIIASTLWVLVVHFTFAFLEFA